MIKDSDKIVWVILNATKNLKVGKYKLAEFLKGSKSKDISNLSSQQGYGGLLWQDIATIIGFTEQLEQMKLIARRRIAIDDYYSILELTEAGKKVLDEKIKIELQVIKKEKSIIAGESELQTYRLFKSGKNAEEIAQLRGLAVSTIEDHLYRLVANGYISSSDFIPEEKIKQIMQARNKFAGQPKLREIKEPLPEDISYNDIKCVLADNKLNPKIGVVKTENEGN